MCQKDDRNQSFGVLELMRDDLLTDPSILKMSGLFVTGPDDRRSRTKENYIFVFRLVFELYCHTKQPVKPKLSLALACFETNL